MGFCHLFALRQCRLFRDVLKRVERYTVGLHRCMDTHGLSTEPCIAMMGILQIRLERRLMDGAKITRF